MTRKQIESRFFGIPHLPAPNGGQFFVNLSSTLSCKGVQWKAEISYIDPKDQTPLGGLIGIARSASPERHQAMRNALDAFDEVRS